MNNTPINYDIVNKKIQESGLKNIGKASIREVKRLINEIEDATGTKFVRMEMGIPGLPAVQIGIDGFRFHPRQLQTAEVSLRKCKSGRRKQNKRKYQFCVSHIFLSGVKTL